MKNVKKLLALLLVLVMCLGTFTGCGSSNEDENANNDSQEAVIDEEATLVIPVSADVVSLNILQNCLTDTGITMMGSMFDHIITLNPDGTFNPGIAKDLQINDDFTEYTLVLRDDVTWHDGEKLDADDIVFTWNCLIEGKLDVGVSAGMYVDGVAVGVEKIDQYTVKFTMPRSSNGYKSSFGLMYVLPEHIFANVEDMNTCEENNLGTGYGPYKLVEHIPGEKLVVERYEDYYGDKPHYKYIEYRIMPDYTAQEAAFLKGEIDYMVIQDAETLAKYETDENYKVYTFSEGRVNYMQINQNSEIFSDPKAREAVCLALDFDAIVAGAYGSDKLAKPATGTVICRGELYYDESVPNYQRDVEKAKQLAKESGLDQKTIKLTYNTGRANMESVALFIQQQLAEANINAEVVGQESSTQLMSIFFVEDGWDLGLNGWASGGKPDYCSWYIKDTYYSLNTYTTDELNALWTAADSASGDITEAYAEVSKLLQSYFTYVPISSTNKVVVTPANTHGWEDSVRGDLSDYTVLYKTK